jgi:hypothetical protein
LLEKAAPEEQTGYHPTGDVKISSEVPVNWASKCGKKHHAKWHWGQYGEEHWLLDREELILARVIPADTSKTIIQKHTPPINLLGGYRFPDAPSIEHDAPPEAKYRNRYIVRLSPGIDYGTPSPLEDARRLVG